MLSKGGILTTGMPPFAFSSFRVPSFRFAPLIPIAEDGIFLVPKRFFFLTVWTTGKNLRST